MTMHDGEAGGGARQASASQAPAPQSSTPQSTAPPRGASKRTVVFAGVLGALLALGTTTRTWIHVIPAPGAINIAPFDVPGSDAATSVAALAIVVLAGSVAAAIAGRFARYVIAVLVFLAGIGIVAAAIGVVLDPTATAAATVGAATGTATVKGEYVLSFWPWLAVAAGAWIIVCSVVLGVAGRRWNISKKYTSPASADARGGSTTGGAAGASGAGSMGPGTVGSGTAGTGTAGATAVAGAVDTGSAAGPTAGNQMDAAAPGASGPARGPGSSAAGTGMNAAGVADSPDSEEHLDEIDGWDSLSRGEDPTG